MEYTKGKWEARKLFDKRLESAYAIGAKAPAYDVDVALIQQYDIDPTEVEANAHLIAQSPRMAEWIAKVAKQDFVTFPEDRTKAREILQTLA